MSMSRRNLLALVPLVWAGSAGMALAAPKSFDVPLTGAQQVPPVDTQGSGTAHLTYDPTTRRGDLVDHIQQAVQPGHNGPFP